MLLYGELYSEEIVFTTESNFIIPSAEESFLPYGGGDGAEHHRHEIDTSNETYTSRTKITE